jgi:hypothetical protein
MQGLVGELTLALPRALTAHSAAFVEVQVGRLARGQEIDVTTRSGREVGVISPYGMHDLQNAGGYTLPLPSAAITDNQVILRLTTTPPGQQQRAVTKDEVRSVKLSILDISP